MKARFHQSNSQFLTHTPSRGYARVVVPILLAMLLFFLLPGLLAAQEVGGVVEQNGGLADNSAKVTAEPAPDVTTDITATAGPVPGAPLSEQATAAAMAAAQPGVTIEAVAPQNLSRELRADRLWLLPRHAEFADLLNRAGRQALQHADCNEVLYGSLNEFKTERIGTSFTILCMKDARTTFNQVFFANDLMSEEELTAVEAPVASEDLERLRQMMVPTGQPDDASVPQQNEPIVVPDDLPAPIVF